MIDKRSTIADAIARIPDGASVMVSGFGSSGTPFSLLDELLRQGQRGLTLIKNDANEDGIGVYKLIQAGQVDKMIASHIGLNSLVMTLAEAGELDVELVPQGILAERIRSCGVGICGFLSRIGLGTDYEDNKAKTELKGKSMLIEPALCADFALIHGERTDYFGNTTFNTAGINFAPLMAMAADHTIVEAKQLMPPGALPPQAVQCAASFVACVTEIPVITEEYHAIRR